EGQRPTVPSPLVGEGQGEGWLRAPDLQQRRYLSSTTAAASRLSCKRKSANTVLNGSRWRTQNLPPPLSLSLPRKGGGNDVAYAFAPPDWRLRLELLSWDSPLAPPSGYSPSARRRAGRGLPIPPWWSTATGGCCGPTPRRKGAGDCRQRAPTSIRVSSTSCLRTMTSATRSTMASMCSRLAARSRSSCSTAALCRAPPPSDRKSV